MSSATTVGQTGAKQIFVNNKDLGFFTATPITAQHFGKDGDGDAVLVWCNHAGATETNVTDWFGHDRTYRVCDKCGAHQPENENYWYEAPIEGAYRD